MKNTRLLWITALSCLLVLSCTSVFGQVTANASIQGVVTDKSQALVGGATVTATNNATGATRSTTTSATGEYRLDSLAAGFYTIKASAKCFGPTAIKNPEPLVCPP